jgi:serine phosphatase RsbU (regulator of sigma subunit)
MRIAARCLGVHETVGIGGDWHLYLALPDGSVLLAVGDVTGHGLDAAPDMLLLRHATVAFAVEGHEPSQILVGLNSVMCMRPTERFATAVVGIYRPGSRQFTCALAGHPPVLLGDHHSVSPLDQPTGRLLGLSSHSTYECATTNLRPNDLVVMYTDGFVERPGTNIDDGIQAFAAQLQDALSDVSADSRVAVIERLRPSNTRDDACVLAAEPIR